MLDLFINIGFLYNILFLKINNIILFRIWHIIKFSLPYNISYRFFNSLISFYYNYYTLSYNISFLFFLNILLKYIIISILLPKRSKWACREALFSLITPGYLLSPQHFLNYYYLIEYLLYSNQTNIQQHIHLSRLWYDTLHLKWGPFFRLCSATKYLGFAFEGY